MVDLARKFPDSVATALTVHKAQSVGVDGKRLRTEHPKLAGFALLSPQSF